jgi:hypothetical protein
MSAVFWRLMSSVENPKQGKARVSRLADHAVACQPAPITALPYS